VVCLNSLSPTQRNRFAGQYPESVNDFMEENMKQVRSSLLTSIAIHVQFSHAKATEVLCTMPWILSSLSWAGGMHPTCSADEAVNKTKALTNRLKFQNHPAPKVLWKTTFPMICMCHVAPSYWPGPK